MFFAPFKNFLDYITHLGSENNGYAEAEQDTSTGPAIDTPVTHHPSLGNDEYAEIKDIRPPIDIPSNQNGNPHPPSKDEYAEVKDTRPPIDTPSDHHGNPPHSAPSAEDEYVDCKPAPSNAGLVSNLSINATGNSPSQDIKITIEIQSDPKSPGTDGYTLNNRPPIDIPVNHHGDPPPPYPSVVEDEYVECKPVTSNTGSIQNLNNIDGEKSTSSQDGVYGNQRVINQRLGIK